LFERYEELHVGFNVCIITQQESITRSLLCSNRWNLVQRRIGKKVSFSQKSVIFFRLAAFQKAQGDPEKIASNMEEIIQEDIAKAKENYEKYLNNYGGGQMQTQNQVKVMNVVNYFEVDEIIAKHKQSKK
jgi:polysaccharide deacetylase 2 family uncharacterized protein YibQ